MPASSFRASSTRPCPQHLHQPTHGARLLLLHGQHLTSARLGRVEPPLLRSHIGQGDDRFAVCWVELPHMLQQRPEHPPSILIDAGYGPASERPVAHIIESALPAAATVSNGAGQQ